jgi:hypothetical protein
MPGIDFGTMRSEIGRESRRAHRTGDHERLDALRRDYAAARLEDYVHRLVADFPPLTDRQRNHLAVLLLNPRERGAA